ncbi:conserved Plasmodium protein, unknown function [Plasmodium vivax]|uniref:Uncharacterized protein n=1 Tax=Plasmodium vivax TaxID=5855 RepID=A0A1G4GYS5_PLAVI|nr:conserved Plasmodium protein, unknown function [Plasmodium vivax]
MKGLPIRLIRNLLPSVTLNRINCTHLLKHLENVCEHMALVGRYTQGGSARRRVTSRHMKKVERNKGGGTSTKETIGRSKLFDQVDEQLNKAVVLLPEFGPSGIIRLLYALQKIKDEKKKRKKKSVLKRIEYYLLRGSLNDSLYHFWSHLRINDAILLFRMFIKNSYFEPALLGKLIGEVVHNGEFCTSSDVVLFLRSYHFYRWKVKRIKRWRCREVSLSDDCLRKLFHLIVRNQFDLTHKEMCTFFCLFSIYGRVLPFDERWVIYSKAIQFVERTQLAYSPRQVKSFILSLFRVSSFLFDGAGVPQGGSDSHVERLSEEGLSEEGLSEESLSEEGLSEESLSEEGLSVEKLSEECLPVVKPTLRSLFHLYKSQNTDVRVEDELRILESALHSHYYHYDSLESILFHIKNNFAQLGLSNGLKFVRLVRKLRGVHLADGAVHTEVCMSNTERKFVRHMLDHILSNCAEVFRARYRYPPRKVRGVLSLDRFAPVEGEPNHEITGLHP